MQNLDQGTKMKTIEEKLANPEFVKEVSNLSVEALDKRLAELAKAADDVKVAKEADEQLALAKDQAKEFGAPYREATRALALKTAYIVNLIKDRA